MNPLRTQCQQIRTDGPLVVAAVEVVRDILQEPYYSDTPPSHPLQIATDVAALNLDHLTETRAESVIASMFENIIAHKPWATDKIKERLHAALERDQRTRTRLDAINDALALAEKVALITRHSRRYADMPDAGDQVFYTTQEMLLGIGDARVVPIKLVIALNDLQHSHSPLIEPAERERMHIIADNTMKPLASSIGFPAAAAALGDHVFHYRDPKGYRAINAQLDQRGGLGFYRRAPAIAEQLELDIYELIKEKTGIDCLVIANAKSIGAITAKEKKKGYPVGEMIDLLRARIVVSGDDPRECARVKNAILGVYKILTEHSEDYFENPDPSRPHYAALHVIAAIQEGRSDSVYAGLRNFPIEFQIRTRPSDAEAELGAACLDAYRTGRPPPDSLLRRRALVREALVLRNPALPPPEELIFADVDGMPYRLPKTLQPPSLIDALAFLPDGAQAMRAATIRLNGQKIDMDGPEAPQVSLSSGDTVSPDMSSTVARRPHAQWLEFARTQKARDILRADCERTGPNRPMADTQTPRNRTFRVG